MKQKFFYRAKDINGKVHEGTIEATKVTTAVNLLKQRHLYITKLKPETTSFSITRKVPTRDLATFSRQLATLLSAGVPILSALNVLKSQSISKQLQKSIGIVSNRINSGYSMASAMKQLPSIFPNIVISMVQAGEQGGRLDDILHDLADYFS